jgi:hypothetical protein
MGQTSAELGFNNMRVSPATNRASSIFKVASKLRLRTILLASCPWLLPLNSMIMYVIKWSICLVPLKPPLKSSSPSAKKVRRRFYHGNDYKIA